MMPGSGSGSKKGTKGKKKSPVELAREAAAEKYRDEYREKFVFQPSNNPSTPAIASPATPIATPPATGTQVGTSPSGAATSNPPLDVNTFSRNFWIQHPHNKHLFRSPKEFEVFQSTFRHRKINDTYLFKIEAPFTMKV